jgi:hypothetical protein
VSAVERNFVDRMVGGFARGGKCLRPGSDAEDAAATGDRKVRVEG